MSQTLGDLQSQWYAEDTGGAVGSAAGGDWLNTASALLGSAGKSSQPQQGQPANFSQADQTSKFDASGWTVATGGSNAGGGVSSWVLFMAGAILARFMAVR